MGTFFIILILFLISIIQALNFYILLGKEIKLGESFKLTCLARALNKCLFTGAGYIVSSYFSRHKKLAFPNALSAFIILEFLSVSLWLLLGAYFGAGFIRRVPLAFVIILILLLIIVARRKHKLALSIREALRYFKEKLKSVFCILPFVILNMALVVLYYYLLFEFFNFHPHFLDILKIISMSFVLGYLSPAPAGLGFKDTGLVLLLMENGLSLNVALSLAILDRILITGFSLLLGVFTGSDLIKEEIRRRFKKRQA
ncbi:MAG: flippase-like domain-containing protein [Candidatus Omnitrophica bacterium]|nr:flippase-like domain-containing protein [Candidatus Omnitrophota bacterium]